MDWSKIPDVIAVGLLAWAFVSVARHSHEPVSHHWLTGWMLIVLHFVGLLFVPSPGVWGTIATMTATLALVWAGLLFLRATVPYRQEPSSRVMHFVLFASYTLVLFTLQLGAPDWIVLVSAAIIGVGPFGVAVSNLPRFNHSLRWTLVVTHLALGAFLLATRHRSDFGDLALSALLFTVYFSCAVDFLYLARRASAGGLISTTGFFLWALVFVIGPLLDMQFPKVRIEDEVWNLPKYIVAVGMILLMFEDQIEHNKYLALHDDLTGLPNRRLFQDRLASALERAKRSQANMALLMLDLDEFKKVNDTLGHHAGDLLLKSVAQLFSGRMRRSDTVARTGGDEFAIILEPPISKTEATHVGRTLLEKLNEPMRLENGPLICVAASLGVAVYPDDAQEMESLCIAADLRMYEDKRTRGADRLSASPLATTSLEGKKDREMELPQ